MPIKLRDIIEYLENEVPLSYQESYDNCGLLIGDKKQNINKALLTLDITESVIDEAIKNKCNLIVSHHPLIFNGIKKIIGNNYVERSLIKAIKNDVAIYTIHTNLDNVNHGVNSMICSKLELQECKILSPKENTLKKLYTFCPTNHVEQLRSSLFNAGAGHIGNYSECSYNSEGYGTFKGDEKTNPFVGHKGKQHQENETKIEVIFPSLLESIIINTLIQNHPYEEVAYDIISLDNNNLNIGSGMIGNLKQPVSEIDFLNNIKKTFNSKIIKHTSLLNKKINSVAVCGGAGSFLLMEAIRKKADIFISSDFKYHQYFDADKKIIIADIGHYESEQFTPEIIYTLLTKKFAKFATLFSKINTNPINYF